MARPAASSGIYSKLTFDDDETLIAGMLLNTPEAWRAFHARYDGLVRRCIAKVGRKFSGVLSEEDMMEIYASFYLSLVANDGYKLRSYDKERARFSSWIGVLAVNAAYDHLRVLRREPPKEDLALADERTSDVPDPFDLAVERQHAELAMRLLGALSERDRDFVTMVFADRLEPQEIAERMNISVRTVYTRKHKLLARMARALKREQQAA